GRKVLISQDGQGWRGGALVADGPAARVQELNRRKPAFAIAAPHRLGRKLDSRRGGHNLQIRDLFEPRVVPPGVPIEEEPGRHSRHERYLARQRELGLLAIGGRGGRERSLVVDEGG